MEAEKVHSDFTEHDNLKEEPKLRVWEYWVRTCVVVLVTVSECVWDVSWRCWYDSNLGLNVLEAQIFRKHISRLIL